MNRELLERMQSGKPFRLDDPAFLEINKFKDRTLVKLMRAPLFLLPS